MVIFLPLTATISFLGLILSPICATWPRGYVTTVSDELGRKTVMDLVDCDARVYPVGRLDKDSEGLLILTNDGSFANALTHPKHNYAKVYRVTVRPSVNDEMLEKMRNGQE